MEKGFRGLIVYQLAYELAGEIFKLPKKFPADEKYELTSQIRRSSRSVCANIAEGYRKRRYPRHFTSKMTDADGEASETTVWLDFARDCGYITPEDCEQFRPRYERIGKILGGMAEYPEKFRPRQ